MDGIVQRLRARADEDENCVTSCIYAAAAQANCGTDIQCICTSSTFRNAALTCLNASCTPLDYDTVLDTVLGACATGGLDAVSSLSDAFLTSASRTSGGSSPTNTRAGSGKNTDASSNSTDDDKGGSNIGAIVGGVVGGLALVALFAGLIWFLVRRSRKPKPTIYAQPYTMPPGSNNPKTPGAGGGDPAQQMPLMAPANAGAYGSGYPSLYTGAPTSAYSTSASSPTMPSPQPTSELGYVPPQSFAMYGPPPGAQQPQYPGYAQPGLAPPSSTGGTSRPSTGSATDYAYQPQTAPFVQTQYPSPDAPQRTSLYAGPAAAATAAVPQQWPADAKRPLQVMSAESEMAGAGGSGQQEQEMPPPPVYRQ
ncbi:hypothetical protein AURDEDRAFT_114235 [Auricularia subglabra TFB-10046 SS5]|nr:hypothetical protein AURDEDRAFT_114235 [Auricularia subglabra TFB-10046 SS5]